MAGSSSPQALRQTALLSCERCSRRKQRCDRELPACSRCRKVDAQCRRPGNEESMVHTKDGHIQKKGAVALLHDRLTHLRTLVREQDTAITIPVNGDGDGDETAQPSFLQQGPDEVSRQRPSELSFGLLSLGAMSEPTRRTHEVLPELSIPLIICAVTEIYGGNPERTRRVGAMWDGIAKNIKRTGLEASDRFVVPHSEALKYFEVYFDTVDFRYPRLPRDEVRTGIDAISAPDHEQFALAVDSSPACVFMAYMITAIVPLVSDSYPGAQASFISIHMLSQALKILDKVFRLEDSIEIIQCLRLLVIFSIHSSAAGSSWHLVNFAVKKCVALGFHQETSVPVTDTQRDQLEQRRWIFWSCYLLDRLICTALDRPYSINDMYITTKLPGEDLPRTKQPTPAEARQIHLFRYAILQSEVLQDRGRRLFQYHLGHLLHWRANAPDYAEAYPPMQYQHLTSIYHTLLLRIIIDQITCQRRSSDVDDSARSLPMWTPGSESSIGPRYSRTSIGESNGSPGSQMKLLPTCRAVVRSLSRDDMKKRSVLSWVTGYSAISAALGLLHCISMYRSLQKTISIEELDSVSPGQDHGTDSYADIASCNELLNETLTIISTVGRHFSRMDRYQEVITRLREVFVNKWRILPPHKLNKVTHLVSTIGVDHLRFLAEECLGQWIE